MYVLISIQWPDRQHCQLVLFPPLKRCLITAVILLCNNTQQYCQALFPVITMFLNITESPVIDLAAWFLTSGYSFFLQERQGCTSLRMSTLRRCTLASWQGRPSCRSTPCWTASQNGRISTCAGRTPSDVLRPTAPGSAWTSTLEYCP